MSEPIEAAASLEEEEPEELTAELLADLPLNGGGPKAVTVYNSKRQKLRVRLLPFQSWSLRRNIFRRMEGHLNACRTDGVKLADGTVLHVRPEVIRTATDFAFRVLNANGEPLLGDPLKTGFAGWVRVSEADATLWSFLVHEINLLDGFEEDVEDTKNASSAGQTTEAGAAGSEDA